MPWDAVDALDDARDATESMLVPPSWGTWLRLALVTFFVSGVGGGGSVSQGVQGAISSPPSPRTTLGGFDPSTLQPMLQSLLPGRPMSLVVGVAVVVLVLGIGYTLVGAVMEFVLVDGLRRRRFTLRRATRQFLGPGVRLLLFRVVVGVVLVGAAAVPVLVALGVLSLSVAGVLLVPLLALVVGVVWLVGVLCLRLTTDFVVPTMIAEGRSVLSAWQRLLPLVRAAWREVALYLAVRLGLGIAATILVGLVVGLVVLVIAIPFALLGSLVVSTAGFQGAGLVALVLLAAVFIPLVVVATVVVQVPVVVYFRYYGLVFLGRLDDRLALV